MRNLVVMVLLLGFFNTAVFASGILEENIYRHIDSKYINAIKIRRAYDNGLSKTNADIFFTADSWNINHIFEDDMEQLVKDLNYIKGEIYISAWYPINITVENNKNYSIEQLQIIKEDINSTYNMTLVEHIFRNNIILYFRNKLYTNENASKETEIISLNIGDYIDVLVEKIEEHFGEVTEMALF